MEVDHVNVIVGVSVPSCHPFYLLIFRLTLSANQLDVVPQIFGRLRERPSHSSRSSNICFTQRQKKEFITFVLSKYIETSVDELDQEKLPILLTNKYQSLEDAKEILGDVANISRLFIEFQEHLYKQKAA
jgi:hypothetical protein